MFGGRRVPLMRKKDFGIYLTVFSLLLLVLLYEHGRDLDPQWLWRGLRIGCLFLTIYALRLFAAGIKQEVRDELRAVTPAEANPDA
jgi:hypothetical protein